MENLTENIETINLKGKLLAATPKLIDQNFHHTVICIAENHPQNGCFGIILNRMHPFLTMETIFKELNINHPPEAGTIPVHMGGPIHLEQIFVLNRQPLEWPQSRIITNDLALTSTIEILRGIAAGDAGDSIFISMGSVVWAPGQIEREIKENIWMVCPLSNDIIFNLPVERKWETAVRSLGIDPYFLSSLSGDA